MASWTWSIATTVTVGSKAFFDRTQHWADLERMADAGTLDIEAVIGVITTHLGADDPRIERLRQLA